MESCTALKIEKMPQLKRQNLSNGCGANGLVILGFERFFVIFWACFIHEMGESPNVTAHRVINPIVPKLRFGTF